MLFEGLDVNTYERKYFSPKSTDATESTLKTAAVTSTENVYDIANVGTLYDGMPITARFDTASTAAISVTLNGGTTVYPVVDFMGISITNVVANGIITMRYNAVNANFRSLVKGGEWIESVVGMPVAGFVKTICQYTTGQTIATPSVKFTPVVPSGETDRILTFNGAQVQSGVKITHVLSTGINELNLIVSSPRGIRHYIFNILH